jgi:hypothetical protein
MGTAENNRKNKKPAKPDIQRTLEGLLERMREELDKLLPHPQRIPVPIPIPVPHNRRRR